VTAKVLVDSRLHIPVKVVDADNIIKKMTHYEFDNAACKNCEFRSIRPSEECRSCSKGGLLDITVLAKYSEIKGKRYVSIPYGEMHRFERTAGLSLKEVKFVNGTSRVPYDYKVKFTGKLREYQKEPFEKMFGELCGVFKAPPRSGKTVIGTAGACHSGFRTVIMADQKDFLDGFLETIEAMTNLPELEEKHGKKLYGFPKTLDDYKNFQIILVTYQSLISDSKNSKKRLKLLNENYGTLFVDECHAGNASCYSRVLASLKMKYRFGLTATPKRKDGRHYLIESIFGPVIAEAFVEELVPKVTLHKTSNRVQSKANYNNKSGWVRFCKFLANHPDRNLGGAKEAKKRKPIIDAAREGKIRCVVGMRKLMQRGLNVPKWDTLYYIMPMNNEPNWKQESCRILTPMENKRTPVIRMFIDPKMDRSMQCARSVLKMCWKFGYAKAKRTPKKLRDWMGVVSRSEALDSELPDYFEPEARVKGQPSNLGMRRF